MKVIYGAVSFSRVHMSVWLAIFSLFIAPVSGQVQQFSQYRVSDGLSQSEILCIFQDSEGFMWFGTQNGLNKFDGYTFDHFINDPDDSTTISNSWIFDITEDLNGDLWIGTKNGLNKYDKRKGHFKRISLSEGTSDTNDKFIYGLAVDESNLYINHSPTLSVLDINSGAIKSYRNTFETGGGLFDTGFPIIKCSNEFIWIGSVNGLCNFNTRDHEFKYFPIGGSGNNLISNGHITSLLEDKYGNVLIGTENGLNIYQGNSERIVRYFHDASDPASLNNNYIQSIIEDHSGQIWIGTNGGGLNRTKGKDIFESAEFTHYRNLADNIGYIGHDIVFSLCEDRSQNLWIGTIAGVDKTDLKKKNITTYRKSDNPNSVDLLDNVIASVYEDVDKRLWIGTWGKGLNILDRDTKEVTHLKSELEGERHLPENHIHVIFKDSKSRIWLGTRNGISILNIALNRFIPVEEYFDAPTFNYFNNKRVYCILEDSNGRFWIGTGNGVCILDTGTKERTILREDGEVAVTISSNLVYSLLEDRDHEIWIATSGGLDRYELGTGRIRHYENEPGSANSLCDSYTISLCEDRNGYIWIGTSSGASRFNKSDSTFRNYSIEDGLPSNIIYDIILDGNDNLWFSTGAGLAMKNPDEESPEKFIIEEEFLGKEFNIKAVYRGEDGQMYFGGIDGLVSFHPDSLTKNEYIPPVSITSLVKESNGIRQNINVYEGEVELTYRDYSFTIDFSALDFTNPTKNRYAYKMKGISDTWIDIGTRRFVPFTNLPPGDYHFHVKGTNNDGVWNQEGASIHIVILPPWWSSKYAYAGYIIAVIVLVIIVIKWRERSLVREKRILEEKIKERTSEIAQKNISLNEQKEEIETANEVLRQQTDELHELNAMKDTFFSILAHDLKNPFSSLHSISRLVATNYAEMNEDEKRSSIEKISKSSELIYNLLENLLTWSRMQKDSIEYSAESFDLSDLIQENIDLHHVPADKKGIRIESNISGEWLAYGDREMINSVIRNLINNAVKFTHRNGKVEVLAARKGEFLEVMVSDEGIGISQENAEKLFRIDTKYKSSGTSGEQGTGLGLILCKDFVEKNKGRIWCESQEDSGTQFYFTIPASKYL